MAVDARRIVGRHVRALLLALHRLAVDHLGVVVVEMDRVERLDQRQVEHREIDRGLVPDIAVIVPGVVRRQHHVAGAEGDVLAVDAGEIALAGQPEADRARRMLVRRHHLVRIVQPIGGVHGRDGRALRREARIDQDQRAALGVVHRDQLGGAMEDRFDIVLVVPQIGHRALRAHQLLDLVMRDVGRRRPERKHLLGRDVLVQRLQRGIAIGQACGRAFGRHGRPRVSMIALRLSSLLVSSIATGAWLARMQSMAGQSACTRNLHVSRDSGMKHIDYHHRRRRLGRLHARGAADRGRGRQRAAARGRRLGPQSLDQAALRLGQGAARPHLQLELRDRARSARSTTAGSNARAAR